MDAVLGKVHEPKVVHYYDMVILKVTNFIMINIGAMSSKKLAILTTLTLWVLFWGKFVKLKLFTAFICIDNLKMINFIAIKMGAITSLAFWTLGTF